MFPPAACAMTKHAQVVSASVSRKRDTARQISPEERRTVILMSAPPSTWYKLFIVSCREVEVPPTTPASIVRPLRARDSRGRLMIVVWFHAMIVNGPL